jgi:hypothetical protein
LALTALHEHFQALAIVVHVLFCELFHAKLSLALQAPDQVSIYRRGLAFNALALKTFNVFLKATIPILYILCFELSVAQFSLACFTRIQLCVFDSATIYNTVETQ